MPKLLWRYYAALRYGTAAKSSQGLAYISIALPLKIQHRVNESARLSCQHWLLPALASFALYEKLKKEAMISGA